MAGSRSWDDIGYREAIENCRTWNAQMGHGRRERLPFFDDHTQVHQVSMNLPVVNQCNIGEYHIRLYHLV